MQIYSLPALSDNYIHVIHDSDSGTTVAVDPSEADPVLRLIQDRGWKLTHVLNTHHHPDHIGGNSLLREATGCEIWAASADRHRIATATRWVGEGDTVRMGPLEAKVMEIPGHTTGHIAFYLKSQNVVFCGDTLFTLGCGRLFEGTPAQMWTSLSRLAALPLETRVYCGHEYTAAHTRFALFVEPGNVALQKRTERVLQLRAEGKPTVPGVMSEELETNPFLRPQSAEIRRNLKMEKATDLEVFTELRRMKNEFKE